MTKTLPDSFSIRWHKNFKNNLKNKFCRVEHTDTHTHRHTFSFIYIDNINITYDWGKSVYHFKDNTDLSFKHWEKNYPMIILTWFNWF